MPTQEDLNRDLAARFWRCHAKGDRQGYLDTLTDDCVFKIGVGKSEGVVPFHGTYRGKSNIETWLDSIRQHRIREYCEDVPVPPNSPNPASHDPRPDKLLVGPGMVAGIGTIRDQFKDGTKMLTSDFVLLLHIDEKQQKIKEVQFFQDTAASMVAWLHHG